MHNYGQGSSVKEWSDEGKSLKDPDISKDKLCGILQKILEWGIQCDQSVSCVERKDAERWNQIATFWHSCGNVLYTTHVQRTLI